MRNFSRTVLIWSGHLFVPLAFCISTDIFFVLVSWYTTRRAIVVGGSGREQIVSATMGREVFT